MIPDINKRLRELREKTGRTQEEWAKIMGLSRSGVTSIESGQRNVTDKHIKLLTVEPIDGKYINEKWLRTGEGEMFLPVLEEDEMALYVSELLEDEGDNPLYTIIKEVMHTYSELSPKSQEVIRDAAAKLLENLKNAERED
ncbi:helix-turn-helix transcriptional regulator [Eubacterium sp. An3]|uniref:helix-turn-helix domain-containing protein n=1 Tax=Eubacterium sp. An3 TaxID=1965628 RepID=UPI001FA847D9|nr:helix-turn-helix transcriptional regulator [Eubacterium sp. An3]